MLDYKQLEHQTALLIQSVGEFLKEQISLLRTNQVETKSLNSLVTYVDKTAEKMLVNGLEELLPHSGFIAEEGTSSKLGKEFNWIIDPLDGTTNYIHGLPMYSISIGLNFNDETVMGLIFIPELNQLFSAIKSQGAFLNGSKIQVSGTEALKNSLIATGFPYYDFSQLASYTQTLEFFLKNTRGVRRMGSAAIDLAYVACGKFDAFYEYSLNAWDVAAGALLVKEAGGIVSDFKGGNNYLFGKTIIASTPIIHPIMLKESGEKILA